MQPTYVAAKTTEESKMTVNLTVTVDTVQLLLQLLQQYRSSNPSKQDYLTVIIDSIEAQLNKHYAKEMEKV
jgi:hypothetical protein